MTAIAIYEKFSEKNQSYFIASAVCAAVFSILFLGCSLHSVYQNSTPSASVGNLKVSILTEVAPKL